MGDLPGGVFFYDIQCLIPDGRPTLQRSKPISLGSTPIGIEARATGNAAPRPLDGLCALLEETARRRLDALTLAAVVAQLAALAAGELLGLTRHLRTRLVPGEEPPAAAVAEYLVEMSAEELRELQQRLRESRTQG